MTLLPYPYPAGCHRDATMQRTSSVSLGMEDAPLVRHRSKDLQQGPERTSLARASSSHPLKSIKPESSSPRFSRFLLAALAVLFLILRPWAFTFGKGSHSARLDGAAGKDLVTRRGNDHDGRRRLSVEGLKKGCNLTTCETLTSAARRFATEGTHQMMASLTASWPLFP